MLSLMFFGVSVEKDVWDDKQVVVEDNKDSVITYLVLPDQSRVKLDLSEPSFESNMTVTSDKFVTENNRIVEKSSTRRTTGFRTVERVLRVGSTVSVFGEIVVGENGERIIKAPRTRNLFDQRTYIFKPHMLLLSSEEDKMINMLEKEAVMYFIINGISTCGLLAVTYLGGSLFVAWKEHVKKGPPTTNSKKLKSNSWAAWLLG